MRDWLHKGKGLETYCSVDFLLKYDLLHLWIANSKSTVPVSKHVKLMFILVIYADHAKSSNIKEEERKDVKFPSKIPR